MKKISPYVFPEKRQQINSHPKSVVALSAINPIESTPQVLKFNFTVDDADGNWTINISSAKVIINYSSIVRQSSACSGIVVNGTAQNISCNVTINYYDLSGTWSVNVSIKDNSTSYVENSTTTFTYNTLTAISLNSNSFNFGTLSIGQQNATTLTPINISNTGNSNFSKASIEGYDLVNGSSMIGAGNMSINATNISNGHIIINNTFVNITNSALGRNNDTLNTSLSLYLYIDVPNMTLPAASYKSINSWVLNMLP